MNSQEACVDLTLTASDSDVSKLQDTLDGDTPRSPDALGGDAPEQPAIARLDTYVHGHLAVPGAEQTPPKLLDTVDQMRMKFNYRGRRVLMVPQQSHTTHDDIASSGTCEWGHVLRVDTVFGYHSFQENPNMDQSHHPNHFMCLLLQIVSDDGDLSMYRDSRYCRERYPHVRSLQVKLPASVNRDPGSPLFIGCSGSHCILSTRSGGIATHAYEPPILIITDKIDNACVEMLPLLEQSNSSRYQMTDFGHVPPQLSATQESRHVIQVHDLDDSFR